MKRFARRAADVENSIATRTLSTNRLTRGSFVASLCIAGSMTVSERTAAGRFAAAARATQPPKECPTRWAPSSRSSTTHAAENFLLSELLE